MNPWAGNDGNVALSTAEIKGLKPGKSKELQTLKMDCAS
jgi:hypothetical protein